jgi:hypothetical protein
MTQHVKTTSTMTAPDFQTEVPEAISQMIKPPVLIGESAAGYTELSRQISNTVGPRNIIEQLRAIDVCYFSYDILRLRQLKAGAINATHKSAVKHLMAKAIDHKRADHNEQVHRLTTGYFTDEKVKAEVESILKVLGLTPETINAQALVECVSHVTAIDALLGTAMSRRDTALREIERGREVLLVDKGQVVDHEVSTEAGSKSEPPNTAQEGVH